MNLIPGKVNSIAAGSLLYEAGDSIDTICYIKSGSITRKYSNTQKVLKAGEFVGHLDIYDEFYSANYYADDNTEIIPLPADSPSEFVRFLSVSPDIHNLIAADLCNVIKELHDMYCTLFSDLDIFYNSVLDAYNKYQKCCANLSIAPSEFMMPHDVNLYKFEEQSFAKNYNIIAGLASNKEKADAVHQANGTKFLKIQTSLIDNIFTAYDDMVFYLRSTVSLFTSKSEQCLFALTANLYNSSTGNEQVKSLLSDMRDIITTFDQNIHKHTGIALEIDYTRVDFFFMTSNNNNNNNDDDMYADAFDDDDDDDLYASAFDDDDDDLYSNIFDSDDINNSSDSNANTEYETAYDLSDFYNSLKQLCDYAGMADRYNEINAYSESFMKLQDKDSRDDNVRILRKKFTAVFYELYEEIFIHYAKEGTSNKLVELFLNFGFLDERLISDNHLEFLCSIPKLNKTSPCKVYRMKDWLMRIYNGEEIPSKNEFDMEYTDYVRELRKNEGLSADAERKLLADNERKARFEIQNMLKYNCRLINGNLLSFFPMLHAGNFDANIENLTLTSEKINEQISSLVAIDYSIFYREMLYANPEKGIEKETIQKEIFPNIILFPVVGINGIMWQEISGKRSNSEGRIFLPAFFNGSLGDTLLTIFGRFHWELCKTIQGTAWNNISIPSLTSEYSDYIQFYRKNKDLSAEKKEALKNQFTRCRNNMREIFVYDYIIWMKFESSGSIRLNKIARRMLATYCPFSKNIRQKIATQPIFEEAMAKFQRDKQKKIKEVSLRFKALEKKGTEMVEEIVNTQRFYEEL